MDDLRRFTGMVALMLLMFLSVGGPLPASAAQNNATFENLSKGNQAFMDGTMTHPQQSPARRKALVAGQKPPAIILSCADSRVPPELIFDQGLGDLFVVRVAGNVLNKENLASIEYAYSHLGAGLLIVLGHNACGAVSAAVNTAAGQSAGSANLDALVQNIRTNIQRGGGTLPSTPYQGSLDPFVKDNIEGVVLDLTAKSQILADAVKSGRLVIIPAVYSLETGKVLDLR